MLFDLVKFTSSSQGASFFQVAYKMVYSLFRFDTRPADYFYLEFYDKTKRQVASFVDTLSLYKFQRRMNRRESIPFFKDKLKFYKKFDAFITHPYYDFSSADFENFQKWIFKNRPSYLFCKNSKGQVGKGILKVGVSEEKGNVLYDGKPLKEFYAFLLKKKLDLVEAAIEQHPLLNTFHPHSLNTVRVITVLDKKGGVHFLGTILRMGVEGNHVDNFDAGGVSAVINTETGVIEGPLVFKDPRNTVLGNTHPTTGQPVIGIQLPYWKELMAFVVQLCYVVPEIRTVGWDIAITPQGPLVLEGNQNWDKTHWQKSYGKGMMYKLNAFD